MLSIHDLLEIALKFKASDLMIKAGAPPAIRVDGLIQLTNLPIVSPQQTRELAYEIMYCSSRDVMLQFPEEQVCEEEDRATDNRMKRLEESSELDMVFTIPNMARVRANLFLQRGTQPQ